MKCPKCGHDTSVIDSRVTREGREIRRRRTCENCNYRFTTYERPEERLVYIVKKDQRREPFNRDKIFSGMHKACEKLNISSDDIDQSVNRLNRRVHDLNVDEVESTRIGQFVMEALYELDEVAYIRFASVYLRFQDISEFTRHVEALRRKRKKSAAQSKT